MYLIPCSFLISLGTQFQLHYKMRCKLVKFVLLSNASECGADYFWSWFLAGGISVWNHVNYFQLRYSAVLDNSYVGVHNYLVYLDPNYTLKQCFRCVCRHVRIVILQIWRVYCEHTVLFPRPHNNILLIANVWISLVSFAYYCR